MLTPTLRGSQRMPNSIKRLMLPATTRGWLRFFAINILHLRNGKIFEDWYLKDSLTFQQ